MMKRKSNLKLKSSVINVPQRSVGNASTKVAHREVAQKFVDNADGEVRAVEGETILLKCIVAHLQGKAQWNRNRTIIFDQEIPTELNSSRHFVIVGNQTAGDFSLEIRNIRIDDAGTYECHIRPKIDSEYYIALTALTKLTVKPRSGQHSYQLDKQLPTPMHLSNGQSSWKDRDCLPVPCTAEISADVTDTPFLSIPSTNSSPNYRQKLPSSSARPISGVGTAYLFYIFLAITFVFFIINVLLILTTWMRLNKERKLNLIRKRWNSAASETRATGSKTYDRYCFD